MSWRHCVHARSHSADFSGFDYVLAMDRANLDELARFATAGCAGARRPVPGIRAPDWSPAEVPDPYYGGTEDFGACSTSARPGRAPCCGGSACAPETRIPCAWRRTDPARSSFAYRRGADRQGPATTTRPRTACARGGGGRVERRLRVLVAFRSLSARRFRTFCAWRLGTLRLAAIDSALASSGRRACSDWPPLFCPKNC